MHLWDNGVHLETTVSDACQHIFESMEELDVVVKVAQLGVVIAQLQQDNVDLQGLVHLDTPPEQVVERKSIMEDPTTHLEEMEKEAKKVTKVTSQFLGSVVQDE